MRDVKQMNFFELIHAVGEKWKAGEIKETSNPIDNDLSIFHFVPDGMIYGANKKKKKDARATIAIPSDVCGECISDLGDWKITIIAIKKDKLQKVIEEWKLKEKVN